MNKPNKYHKRLAFTLVEIIVSIAIVVIMSVAVAVVFSARKDEISLSLFKGELIADLRFTQVKSMNSINNLGIFIESENRFILFEDLNGNNLFSAGEEVRVVELPERIIFTLPSVGQNIVFRKDGSPAGGVDITLTTTDRVTEKSVSINSIGLIN